jgi:hypothetical protein
LPQLNVQGRTTHLGALQVMETAAAIQGLRMEDADIPLSDGRLGFALTGGQRETLMQLPLKYSICVHHVEQCANVPPELAASVAVLAADIALASHIETLSEAGIDNVRWEDWHPGWRFVKAVAAIETLVSDDHRWPRYTDELRNYCEDVRRKCGWPEEPNHTMPLNVFEDHPSRSDILRGTLAKEAFALRKKHSSLWSIGPRQDLIDASFKWLPPPLLIEYGRDSIRATRPDIDKEVISDVWVAMQLNHIAWQIFGHNATMESIRRIECFPWSKEGSHHACSSSNGECRWFPPPVGTQLPTSCPMLQTLQDLCGKYWERLRPL